MKARKGMLKLGWVGMVFSSLWIWGCGHEGSAIEGKVPAHQSRLALALVTPPDLPKSVQGDSVVLKIQGPGMDVYQQKVAWDSLIPIGDLPAGNPRQVQVEVLNNSGKVLFSADTTLAFVGGTDVTLDLKLRQQFGSIKAKVPLPLIGSRVQGGVLRLKGSQGNYQTYMVDSTGEAQFILAPIDFGDYTIEIRFWNDKSDTLYSYDGAIQFKSGVQTNLIYRLESLLAGVQMRLQLVQEWTHEAEIIFPDASLRSPQAFGELVFSELMPNPGVSADSIEWLELKNATGDTLNLHNCSIKKSRGSTAGSTVLSFDSIGFDKIAPSAVVVLGREKAAFAQFNYKQFTMSNTSQDMLILCGNQLVDSLNYRDSLGLFGSGFSQQLDLRHYAVRQNNGAWCSGLQSFTSNGLNMKGSPGQVPNCY